MPPRCFTLTIALVAGVGASIILVDSPGGKLEIKDLRLTNGAALEKVGVLTACHTDDPITDSRWLMRMAGLAVRAGMSRPKALEGEDIYP